MFEFTKVFAKGHIMDHDDVRSIMKCKNIDYGHTSWIIFSGVFANDVVCTTHIIDNIIDVNVYNHNNYHLHTFFVDIMYFNKNPYKTHYMLNNGYINNKSFEELFRWVGRTCEYKFCDCCSHKQFDKLTDYLTKVSLGKFTGYYNIEKYYDVMYTMLLIMKAQ